MRMCSSLDRHSVILLGKKRKWSQLEHGPTFKPKWKDSCEQTRSLSCLLSGSTKGWEEGSTRKVEKEKDGGRGASSCLQMEDACVQIWAGWEKRHEQSTRTGGLDLGPRNTNKIDSVYVAGFLSGCRMCVDSYQHFFSSSRVLLTGCLNPSSVSFGNLMKKNKQLSQICDAQARSSS